jgi:hypothetical protein
MFVIALLVAAPLFIDTEKYKEEYLVFIKKSTGLETKIDEKTELQISFFPVPKIVVNSIYIENSSEASTNYVFYSESIVSKISLSKFLMGDLVVKDVKFVRPVFEFEEYSNGDNNWTVLLDKLKKRERSKSDRFPDKVVIENGTFSYIRDLKKTSLDYFNLTITADSFSGPFNVMGSLSQRDNLIKFNGGLDAFKEGAKFNFNIQSSDSKVNLNGAFKDGTEPKLEGNMALVSSDISNVMNVVFDKNSTLSQVTSKEELKMSGVFSISKLAFKIENILIDSKSIQGEALIEIDYNMQNSKEGMLWKIHSDIDKLDLDTLYAEETKEEEVVDELVIDYYAYSVDTFSIADFKFNVPKNLNMALDLKFDDILYNDKISNVKIKTNIINGHAEIEDMSAELPGNSRASLSGKIEHNGTRPLFVGEVEFGGGSLREVLVWVSKDFSFIPEKRMNEFLLTSKLRVTPQQVDMTEVSVSFDKSLFSSELSIRPLKTIPIVNIVLNIDRMDFDQYNLDKKIFNEIYSFFEGADDTVLERSWLSKLSSRINLSLNANDILFNGQYIDNFSTDLNINRDLFGLQKLYIDSESAKVSSRLRIDISNREEPNIELLFKSTVLDTQFLIPTEEYDKEKDFGWSKERFNFLGLGEFYGNYEIEIDEFIHKKLIVSNIKLSAERDAEQKRGVLKIKEFLAGLYNGELKMEGEMSFSNRSLGFGLSLTGVDINPLLRTIEEDTDISGQVFFIGSFVTSGRSLYEWIYYLQPSDPERKADLILQKFRFKGFDLEKIIRNAKRLYSFIDMQEVIEIASETGETEFKWIQGKIGTKNGILEASNFKLVNDYSRGDMKMRMNLYNFDTKALATIKFEPERNRLVDIPIKLDGNFINLNKDINTKNLEIYITDKASR